ncbi:MAG: SOS response-associated peptidase, partial [Phycisphaeraceae bacterium]
MCGRYVINSDARKLAEVFDAEVMVDLAPRYNVAPSQPVPIVRVHRDGPAVRRIELVRWGLIPHWADDPAIGNRLINARAETAAEKPAFRDAFRYRRCLVPADAFYEWKPVARGRKRPYVVRRDDREPMGLAGLWEHWQDADGNELETCVILTAEARGPAAELHERMPVVLERAAWDAWLDPRQQDRAKVQSVLDRLAMGGGRSDTSCMAILA